MDALHHGIRGNDLVKARRRRIHRPIVPGSHFHQLRPVNEIMHNTADEAKFSHILHRQFSHETSYGKK